MTDTDMYDVAQIRKDFPILERTVHGRPLVYLDNAATTQKPRAVIDALVHYYERYNANIHRGLHTLAEEATAAYEATRLKVGRFINAAHPEQEIIFTRNTTESINLVAHAWGRKFLKPGDEILFSAMEHHSNLVPWHLVAKATGAVIRYVEIDETGHLVWDDFLEKLGDRTKIVAMSQMSNVLGTINPIKEIAGVAHRAGAVVLVDGAQSVPHMAVDVQALGCDFLAFSAHKMLGPTGVGVLYGKREVLEAMDPFLGGGEMIMKVTYESSTYAGLPHKFEAGTPNIADVIAFAPAIDYLEGLGMEAVRRHEVELTQYAIDVLSRVEGVTVYGPSSAEEKGGAVAFNLGELHPHDLSQVLDQQGIAIRAGHHCAQPLMRELGVVATARASFYIYNTKEEVDALVDGLGEAERIFGHVAAASRA
ncbi:MAG TPA: cysteine desulfurase [Dehalococcoidia bacterium]|nr:cysteine desulfurase [Dehalococcoidia bacterium]